MEDFMVYSEILNRWFDSQDEAYAAESMFSWARE